MNNQTCTTPADESTTITASIDVHGIPATDSGAEMALYDAFSSAADALQGVLLQPRCLMETEDRYNAAGEVIDGLVAFFDDLKTQLIKRVEQTPSTTAKDSTYRRFLMLRHEVGFHEDLAKIAALAASLSAEHIEVERNERRSINRPFIEGVNIRDVVKANGI